MFRETYTNVRFSCTVSADIFTSNSGYGGLYVRQASK